MRIAHPEDNGCEGNGNDRQYYPASKTIDQSPDADREESADQGSPKVDAREVDAIDLQIAKEWLGYESEALCAAGQSADHRERCDEDVNPTVIKRKRERLLAYFSSHEITKSE
jgi:hypothetical protein